MGYVTLFSHIVYEEIEGRTGDTTHSKPHLFKVAGLSLEIQTSEPQVLVICSSTGRRAADGLTQHSPRWLCFLCSGFSCLYLSYVT